MQGHNRRAHFRTRLLSPSKNRRPAATRQPLVLLNSLTVEPARLAISAPKPTMLAGSPLPALSNTFGGSATFEQVA